MPNDESRPPRRHVLAPDALSRVLGPPGELPERRLRGRVFALVWAAGTTVVLVALVVPGGEREEPEAITVGVISLGFALAAYLGAGRFPRWSFDVAVSVGTVLVSILVWRSTGASSPFVPLYLWELAFAAAFLPAWRTALQCGLAAGGYLAAVHIGDRQPTTERILIILATLAIVPALVAVVRGHVEQLIAELDRQATHDALTGLANRRAFTSAVALEQARAARTERPLSIIVLDVDHFKALNDRFGHPAGDRALVHVASLLRRGCRGADIPARIGGEEFAVLLPETDGPTALAIADRLRATIAASGGPDGTALTASFGVAQSDGSDPLAIADRALYEAKAEGRNRCVLAGLPAL